MAASEKNRSDLDDGHDDDDKSPQEPRPEVKGHAAPNGGYGWVITAASFCINLLVHGTIYAFGIYFPYVMNHFGATKGQTAFVGSLVGAMFFISGPICSGLINIYGCRFVVILGSLISAI